MFIGSVRTPINNCMSDGYSVTNTDLLDTGSEKQIGDTVGLWTCL